MEAHSTPRMQHITTHTLHLSPLLPPKPPCAVLTAALRSGVSTVPALTPSPPPTSPLFPPPPPPSRVVYDVLELFSPSAAACDTSAATSEMTLLAALLPSLPTLSILPS